MSTIELENVNVSAFDTMPTPEEIHARLPLSTKAAKTVKHGRDQLRFLRQPFHHSRAVHTRHQT